MNEKIKSIIIIQEKIKLFKVMHVTDKINLKPQVKPFTMSRTEQKK